MDKYSVILYRPDVTPVQPLCKLFKDLLYD